MTAGSPSLLDRLTWRSIGPTRGGRSVAVAGDPTDPNVFYFGSTGGGVWKTVDAGAYWRNVSDRFFRRASVGAIAVAHSDPNVIYVGMGETTIRGNVSHGDGVYKSTDGGQTWTHLGLAETRNIGKVRIDPRDPDRVYVAALGHAHGPNPERGLYRSTDGGRNWERVLYVSDKAGAVDCSLDPNNPRILYATIWEAHRGPHYLTSGGEDCGLWRSTDGGDTWVSLNDRPGLPTGLKGKIGVAVSPARSGRVWAIVEAKDGGIFRSDDGGETWEKLTNDHRLRQRPWYYSHIVADPRDPETVWVLNVELFKSVDGGKTFNVVTAPHGDNHDLWIDPANPLRMILGNDGGATISLNGGVSWTSQYGQPTAEMYHVTVDTRTPYRVYGSQQDNTSISVPSRSDHGAITRSEWYEVGGGEAGYIAVNPENPDIVYAGEYMGILTRYDRSTGHARLISVWPEEYSGHGAKDYKYRFQWTYPIVISPHDPRILYVGGNHVFKSADEGEHWEPISPDLSWNDPATQGPSGGPITKDNTGAEVYGTVFTLAESPKQPGLIWAGTDDGRLHVTRDGGETWTEVTPPDLPERALMSIVEPSPHDPAVAYLAATRYKFDDFRPYLYKTTDYGQTWTKITGGIPEDDFTRVIREDPQRRGLLFAGTETGIYVSFDDGVNWQRLGGDLPAVPIHDFVIAGTDLVVATHGRSFWILDDITLLRQVAAQHELDGALRLFTPRETIRWGGLPAFGFAPVKGLNYAFAATQHPAYDFEKLPDGEVKIRWLDAGANPPDGAIIHYELAAEVDEIVLEILDAGGAVLRTVKSTKEKPAAEDEEKEFPAPVEESLTEVEEQPYLSRKAGLNRFIWNLRPDDATKIEGKGGDKPGRSGPRVPPGEYQVRITASGETRTASFRLVKDPRVATTQEQFEEQYALCMRLHRKHSEINQAVNRIRALRRQAEDWARRVKGSEGSEPIIEAAKALKEKLDAIEGELIQVKIESPQDSLNYSVKLNTKIAALLGGIDMAEAAPTPAQRELADELIAKTDTHLAALAKLLEEDVAAFNALVAKSGIPALAPPPADPEAQESRSKPKT